MDRHDWLDWIASVLLMFILLTSIVAVIVAVIGLNWVAWSGHGDKITRVITAWIDIVALFVTGLLVIERMG